MSELRKSLRGYLALRRALGFKLESQGRLLHRFVDFAEEQGASFITRDLALRLGFGVPPRAASSLAKRLQIVRTFAEYRAGADPRTEIPPRGLLPDGYRRRSPYVYSDDDIRKLIEGSPATPFTPGSAGRRHSPRCLDYLLSPVCGSANALHWIARM